MLTLSNSTMLNYLFFIIKGKKVCYACSILYSFVTIIIVLLSTCTIHIQNTKHKAINMWPIETLKLMLTKPFSLFQVHIIMFGQTSVRLIAVDIAVRPDADWVGLLLVGSKTQASCSLICHWDPSRFRSSSPTSGQGDFSAGGALAILDGNWLKNRRKIKCQKIFYILFTRFYTAEKY